MPRPLIGTDDHLKTRVVTNSFPPGISRLRALSQLFEKLCRKNRTGRVSTFPTPSVRTAGNKLAIKTISTLFTGACVRATGASLTLFAKDVGTFLASPGTVNQTVCFTDAQHVRQAIKNCAQRR